MSHNMCTHNVDMVSEVWVGGVCAFTSDEIYKKCLSIAQRGMWVIALYVFCVCVQNVTWFDEADSYISAEVICARHSFPDLRMGKVWELVWLFVVCFQFRLWPDSDLRCRLSQLIMHAWLKESVNKLTTFTVLVFFMNYLPLYISVDCEVPRAHRWAGLGIVSSQFKIR